jgi:hypothetical protein
MANNELYSVWGQFIKLCHFAYFLTVEITLSMRALEVQLSDMEDLTNAGFFKEILNREGK